MKKFVSKVNGREFWVSVDGGPPVEGLPHFSQDEILAMKGKLLSPEELTRLFDFKLAVGEIFETPSKPQDSDIGVVVAVPNPTPKPREDLGYKPKSVSAAEERKQLAIEWSGKIKEMLRSKGAMTAKEKAALLQPKAPVKESD